MSAPRPIRVGHSILSPGEPLSDLPARLEDAAWDMVELDVLAADGRLVVAHDPRDLRLPALVELGAALRALTTLLAPQVSFDIDVKATGYETEVATAIADAGISKRTLVSTMYLQSLRVLRPLLPHVKLGLSIPLARRDYLASRWTRPAAHATLIYLRRVLPAQVARVLGAGEADAIMAHKGVVTPRLARAVHDHEAQLYAWTVDDPAHLEPLLELGVDAVITNRRDLFSATSR